MNPRTETAGLCNLVREAENVGKDSGSITAAALRQDI